MIDIDLEKENINHKRNRSATKPNGKIEKENNDEANNEEFNSDNEITSNKKNLQIHNNYYNKINSNKKNNYRLIEPFRTVGLIIDNNEVVYYKRAHERFMLCSNFNSFLLYNLEKLRLERISPPLHEKITALAMYKNKVFTAVGDKIFLWEKIHIVKEYINPNKTQNNSNDFYKKLLTFDKLLLALHNNGDLLIFDIFSGKLLKILNLKIEYFLHPATYLNKILFANSQEKYEQDLMINNTKITLYNINSEKIIFEYDFENILNVNNEKINNSKITVMSQSPVIDVIAIGFSTGDIFLFNLKTFKTLVRFKSNYSIEQLSFSNYPNLGLSLLSSTGVKGDIHLWDLNKNTLHYTINSKPGTDFRISSLFFLPNEPLLLTTSVDENSIKMYKLEANTGTPMLLKKRTGHNHTPQKIRFYGESANNESTHILSISETELRNMSIINEHISKEFSFKSIPKEITHFNHKILIKDFDFNEFREHDWSNILVNLDSSEGTDTSHPLLFSYENSACVDKLVDIKNSSAKCTSVNVSMCGNFGFAGFSNGSMEKFNMQSGFNRWNIDNAHSKLVNCLKSDGINSLLVSISLDCTLKFWDIFQGTHVKTITLESTPIKLEICRDNDLVAVSLINGDIHIYDKSNFKLVRQIKNGVVTNDLCFSKDGKWLVIVNEDKSLKIYDILANCIIEWVEFKYMPVSVTISPNNQYIAISYLNLNGIYLWINRNLFVDFVELDEIKEPLKITLPFSSNLVRKIKNREELYNIINEDESKQIQTQNKSKKNEFKNRLTQEKNEGLIKLSKENKLKFRIINHLEEIQEKNEPKIKKKDKVKAPFFLFNINNLNSNSEGLNKETENQEFLNILKNYSHFKNEKSVKNKNEKDLILTDLLNGYSLQGKTIKSKDITSFLNALNPYLIDLEIRNLDPILNINIDYLTIFLDYILEEVRTKNNFEMVQAFLNRFLKVILYF